MFDETLIDEIYEAAFVPERCVALLEKLAALVACEQAFIFSTEGKTLTSAIGNSASLGTIERIVSEDWMPRNPQAARTIALGEPRFIIDHDIFSDEEIASSVYYRDFLDKSDAYWGTGSLIRGPSGDNIIVSIHRPKSAGPVTRADADKLTALRPHLARAALMAARLRMQEARTIVGTLAELGLPAATITANGRLHVANPLFDGLVPDVLADFRSRIRFVSPGADTTFEQALSKFRAAITGRGSITFPVAGTTADQAPTIIHLVPITGVGCDVFGGASLLMVAIPVAVGVLDPLILEGLFDLTVSEAHVARGIAEGRSVEAIAMQRNASIETVRSQLKSVMQKTGTHRQNELAALLSGARGWPRVR